eukprot:12919525-Prorocentrum_lima.AAC.1
MSVARPCVWRRSARRVWAPCSRCACSASASPQSASLPTQSATRSSAEVSFQGRRPECPAGAGDQPQPKRPPGP